MESRLKFLDHDAVVANYRMTIDAWIMFQNVKTKTPLNRKTHNDVNVISYFFRLATESVHAALIQNN